MVLEQATKSSEYSHAFLQATAEEFSYYKSFAERAIAQISDEQLHTPLDDDKLRATRILVGASGRVGQQLPDAQREAVILHYWQDWTVAAIAEHLGRSSAAVAGLLKRGLQQLREVLREREE